MTSAKGVSVVRKAWEAVVTIAFLAIIGIFGPDNLTAQRPASTLPVRADASEHPDFTGSWARPYVGPNTGDVSQRGKVGSFGFVEDQGCRDQKDALGNPLERCSLPFNEIKKNYLNARGLAWLKFADEYLSGKWYCIPPTVPVSLDVGTTTFTQVGVNTIIVENGGRQHEFRTVHMDGRPHPTLQELFYQGHSIGWYDAGDLVIETTNFTFDPTGVEDASLLPSSFLKKVTERYKKVSADKLLATVTLEDPLFYKKPYTWSFELKKTAHPEAFVDVCDTEAISRELKTLVPDRYADQ